MSAVTKLFIVLTVVYSNIYASFLAPRIKPFSRAFCCRQQAISAQTALHRINTRYDDLFRLMKEKGHENQVEVSWLPGWRITKDHSSVEGAAILNECIKEKQLSLLRVPEIMPLELGDTCLTEFIPGSHDRAITLEQIKQLVTLLCSAEKSLSTIVPENIVHMDNGQLSIMNTPLQEFSKDKGYSGLIGLYREHKFMPEAKEFLKQAIIKHFGSGSSDIDRIIFDHYFWRKILDL